MKTKEKAIAELIERVDGKSYGDGTRSSIAVRAFNEALEWAQEWIPVEKEYPPAGVVVLFKTSGCRVPVTGLWTADGFISWDSGRNVKVTHWRLIERE